ncbi:FecCD family ABC transporter permease [Thermoflavimicrobium dichotomicum]|uniref:Iron complex transport system permease protein n=1 Tax=Thermoflavimicrobium dichotomicum TaxID=46223 RepID=A0A1I3LTG1_9BACL|nr:iron ABC transporter permease [Thermoflavimicrobium dichotomicum]SFI87795.1 iron complex transport system permease protein [Thermoflavimicrobium dichotomicum]
MREILHTRISKIIGLVIGALLVLGLMLASIMFGFKNMTFQTVWDSFFHFNGSNEHLIIQTSRVPRTVIAAVVGASLAIAGGLMQGLTRNPLASPATLGINAGASFFIVMAVSFFSVQAFTSLMVVGLVGAALTSLFVYFLGSLGRDGMTPVKLTLAGTAVAALFASLTQGILVMNEKGLEELLFWLTGSVQGRKLEMVSGIFPFIFLGWLFALLVMKQMNVLALGDDVARGLGMKLGLIKLSVGGVIILLAGGSVAIAGPIVFVGLIVPHIVRAMVGIDYRWIIPYCAIFGAIFLISADLGGRFIMTQQEIPVGVMTAIMGTPFFIYLARRNAGEKG